ncbi:MAG: zinc ribbon domain-containing protein [Gemmatimonadetes bacterium]|nr:zinc ribbon domain-containing protein [Gemmatimonadota bacterium]
MWEMIAGLLVALAALALVLEPLALGRPAGPAASGNSDELDLEDPTESDSPKVRALLALREIEFDRATGKLAEEDYVRLKAKYESDAIAAIRAEEQAAKEEARPAADRAEEVIRRAKQQGPRVCPTCGPRPEPNAVYCSSCGRSLVAESAWARCTVCGAALTEGAKFCAECGGAIAA